MKRIHIVGIALAAMLVLSAVVAVSAFAAELEWLVNGSSITSALPAETKEKLQLGDLTEKVKVECEISSIGTIGPGSADTITEVLNTKKEANIVCSYVEKGLCEGSTALLEAVNLPWTTNLSVANKEVFDTISADGKGEPGYLVECSTILGKTTDECLGSAKARVENAAAGVDGTFEGPENENKGECSFPKEKVGDLESPAGEPAVITSTSGTVSISGTGEAELAGTSFYGTIKLNTPSAKTFTVLDPKEILLIGVVKVVDTDLGEFREGALNTCNGAEVLVGKTCQVEAIFEPLFNEKSTGFLEVPYEERGSKTTGTLRRELRGTGN